MANLLYTVVSSSLKVLIIVLILLIFCLVYSSIYISLLLVTTGLFVETLVVLCWWFEVRFKLIAFYYCLCQDCIGSFPYLYFAFSNPIYWIATDLKDLKMLCSFSKACLLDVNVTISLFPNLLDLFFWKWNYFVLKCMFPCGICLLEFKNLFCVWLHVL